MIEHLLQPASTVQIMKRLARLRLHFPTSNMSEQELAMLLQDYIAGMAVYPVDIIEMASLEYLRSKESLYFPKLGQLISLMNKYWYQRKWDFERLKKLRAVSDQASASGANNGEDA